MNAARSQFVEVLRMWVRVSAAGYAAPAHMRLLDAMNDLLKPITTLEAIDHDGQDGLTYPEWLCAIELRRHVLRAAIELDG